jgi:lysophospholipase L1-like esterase
MSMTDFPAGGFLGDYLAFWAVWIALVAGTFVFLRRTKGRPGAVRLVLGNALVLLSMLATVVLGAETYLRYVYDETDSYLLMLTNLSWMRRHVNLNSDGFRSPEFVKERRPGVERVACVGDSFTMGWGVRDPADCFPQRVGAALEARHPGQYEVRNYGLPGMTTGHEMRMIADLVARGQTDHVILGYCLNDPDDLLPPGSGFSRDRLKKPWWAPPTASFAADFVWFRMLVARDSRLSSFFSWEKEAYADPRIFAAQADRFRRISETCRASAIRLDVVVFPFFTGWGDGYEFDFAHDHVAEAWRELGVPVVDLREAYRGIAGADLMVNRFDGHPNARAHEIAAKTIVERIFGVR